MSMATGSPVRAVVRVRLAPCLSWQAFEQWLRAIPSVLRALIRHEVPGLGLGQQAIAGEYSRPLVRRDDQRPAGPGYRPLRRLFMGHKLLVPVRTTAAGMLALRIGRLPSGERTGLAFTSEVSLVRTLGPAQRWTHLPWDAFLDMLEPLGIEHLRVDPDPDGRP